MGWYDAHLHQLTVGETAYGEPDPFGELDVKSERAAKLNQVAPGEKSRVVYDYDFGDSWEHEILVEKVMPPAAGVRYPGCLAGKRACPPDDCGGVWGDADLLEAIRDPAHEEHESMIEWLGGGSDPEAFDVDAVTQALLRVR